MMDNYRICKRCVMDTTDPEIVFDDRGFCNHCNYALNLLNEEPFILKKIDREKRLEEAIKKIKESGKNKKYDCLIGVSGGVDSTFIALLVKEYGLRPLAIHFDNGWNSEIANKNIENICNKLEIDLFTYVVNWEEFKDLQLSFLKASTPDSEIPSDHAIFALLFSQASKWNIKYIISGWNTITESILPAKWSQGHSDLKYIKSVQKKFGKYKLKTYPKKSYLKDFYYRFIKGIKWFNILDYMEYDKDIAKNRIIKELSWQDYGGKHLESNYTKIYQSYILPMKFGYDKRRAHLSNLIIAEMIDRDNAIEILKIPPYNNLNIENEISYLTTKFDISKEEFEQIMKSKPKDYLDYPNYKVSLIYKIFGNWRKKIVKNNERIENQ